MKPITIVGLTLLGLSLAACKNTEKGPYAAKKDTIATTTTPADPNAGWGQGEQPSSGRREYPQIEVDAALHKYISVAEPAVVIGEVMQVTVPLRLLADGGEFARVQYQFMFFDEKGVPLKIQPDWRYIRLEERRQDFIQGTSMDRAATWRLRIRTNQ